MHLHKYALMERINSCVRSSTHACIHIQTQHLLSHKLTHSHTHTHGAGKGQEPPSDVDLPDKSPRTRVHSITAFKSSPPEYFPCAPPTTIAQLNTATATPKSATTASSRPAAATIKSATATSKSSAATQKAGSNAPSEQATADNARAPATSKTQTQKSGSAKTGKLAKPGSRKTVQDA